MSCWGVIKGIARGFAAILTFGCASNFTAHAAVLGSQVSNVAQVSYTISGGNQSITPPAASFTIEAARTPSTIEFLRYSPHSPDAIAVKLNGSDYLPASGGAFSPVGPEAATFILV